MTRAILFLALIGLAGPAWAQSTCSPNANENGPPFVVCPIPAENVKKLGSPVGRLNVVLDYGADPTGVADSAPAFRFMAAVASNHYLIVPPGTYLFASTVPSGYPVLAPANVRFQNQSNFLLDMRGATLTTSNSASYSGMLQFDATTPGGASNFTVLGGIFVGNHNGAKSGQETCGIVPVSVKDFRFEGQTFTGNWGGLSAAFCGDWQVNGAYRDINIHNAGQCFDYAFINNVTFNDIHADGADADGTNGSNKVGMKCFSFIYDTPMNTYNNTGVSPFGDTNGISVKNSSARNFIQAWLISSGSGYVFSNNHWEDNPGCTANVGTCATWNSFVNSQGSAVNASSGYGGAIIYDGVGSINHPPGGVISQGESYVNNGNATNHGGGIFIATSLIANNNDQVDKVIVSGSIFRENNNTAVDASAGSAGKLLNVSLRPRCENGTTQTTCVSANVS